MPTAPALDSQPMEWLTLDEVAARLRFPSRRALLWWLRKNPVPVYRRTGSQRYFMRADDLDRVMQPVPLQPSPSSFARRPVPLPAPGATYERVETPAPRPVAARRRGRKG